MNIESGECIKTLNGHSGYVFKLELAERGELISCSADHSIKVWDIENERAIPELAVKCAHE